MKLRLIKAYYRKLADKYFEPDQTMGGYLVALGVGRPKEEIWQDVKFYLETGVTAFHRKRELADGGRVGMMAALHGAIVFTTHHMPIRELKLLEPLYELMNALKDAENGKKHSALVPKNVASRNSLGRKEIEFYARCLIAADVYRAHSGIPRPNAQATILKRKDVIAAAKIRDIDLPGTDHLRHRTMEGWRRHLRERSSSHRPLPLFAETVRGSYDELLQTFLRSLLRGERLQQFKDCTSTQHRFGRHKDLHPLLRNFSALKIESEVSRLFKPSLTNGTDFSTF